MICAKGVAAAMALMTAWPVAAPPVEGVETSLTEVRAGLRAGERGRVVAVIDGDTLVLDTGLEVRLVGVQAPKLPLGRPNFEEWPLAKDSKLFLEGLVLGREVALAYGGLERDRYQRALAHVFVEPDSKNGEGDWVQGALLEAGLARVYSFADNRSLVRVLYTREQAARAKGRGVWSHPYYRLYEADDAGGAVDGFNLVEGGVKQAAEVRGRVYLNFGEDYREDFTVSIAPKDVRAFREEGIDPLEFEGQRVRVRGWVKWFNGPSIDADHPEQIEVLN